MRAAVRPAAVPGPARGRTSRAGTAAGLTAARVYDFAGIATPIDVGTFVLDKTAGVIVSSAWVLPGRASAGIELDIEIGFGTSATDVPDVLRHAVRTLAAHWYENRSLIAIGQSVAMMPASQRHDRELPRPFALIVLAFLEKDIITTSIMTSANAAICAAVHDALAADSGLQAGLGGKRIYDEPPRGALLPYVSIGEARVTDASVDEGPTQEHQITLFTRVPVKVAKAELTPSPARCCRLSTMRH